MKVYVVIRESTDSVIKNGHVVSVWARLKDAENEAECLDREAIEKGHGYPTDSHFVEEHMVM